MRLIRVLVSVAAVAQVMDIKGTLGVGSVMVVV
jgi:hypothetical protein